MALVRTAKHATAAWALDNSEEIVRKHYSHIETGELADQMTTAFEQADQPTPSDTDRTNSHWFSYGAPHSEYCP